MKYLTSNPRILRGKLVIKGTRVPISLIIQLLKDELTIENIHEQYPHITIHMIEGALNEAAEILDKKSPQTQIL